MGRGCKIRCPMLLTWVCVIATFGAVTSSWTPFIKMLGMSSLLNDTCLVDYNTESVNIAVQFVNAGCDSEHLDATITSVTWKFYELNQANNFVVLSTGLLKTEEGGTSLQWTVSSSDLHVYAVVALVTLSGHFGTFETTVTGYMTVGCPTTETGEASGPYSDYICRDTFFQLRNIDPDMGTPKNCSDTKMAVNDVCILPISQDAGGCSESVWYYDSISKTCKTQTSCTGVAGNCFLSDQACQHACYEDKCASIPCQNGGTCSDGWMSYTCNCTSDYSGDNCQLQAKTYYSPVKSGAPSYDQFDLHGDGIQIDKSESIVFEVKGTRNAYILLHKKASDYEEDAIEIVLGKQDNSRSVIRKKNSEKDFYEESGILSASEYRWFWISWDDKKLKIGKGSTVGSEEIMSYWSNKLQINYIHVASGYGSYGYFRFTLSSTSDGDDSGGDAGNTDSGSDAGNTDSGSDAGNTDGGSDAGNSVDDSTAEVSVDLRCLSNCQSLANPQEPFDFYSYCNTCTNKIDMYHWSIRACENDNITACISTQTSFYTDTSGTKFFSYQPTDPTAVTGYYGVTITATLSNGMSGSASLMFQYSPIPEGGSCDVTPTTGYALVTDFSIICTGFNVQGDYNLTYAMYVNTKESTNNAVRVHRGTVAIANGVNLQPGDPDSDYTLYILVRASLENGAYVTVITTVQVLPLGMSDGEESLTDVVTSIIDITNTGQTSVVGDLISQGDVDSAVQYMDIVMSTINTESPDEDSESRTQIRTAVIASLGQVTENVTNTEGVAYTASVLSKTTQARNELTEETQNVAVSVVDKLADTLDMYSENASSYQLTDSAGLLLTGVSHLLDMRTDAGIEEKIVHPYNSSQTLANVKNATEKLLSVASKLSDTLLKRQVSGQNTTTIHTATLSLSVSKVMSDNMASVPYSVVDGNRAAQFEMPESFPVMPGSAELGVQLVYMKKNPYIWDDSVSDVSMGVLSVDVKDENNDVLSVNNLAVPVTVDIPNTGYTPSSNSTLSIHLIKRGNNVTFDPSRSNVLTFNFSVEPNKTTSLTVTPLSNIPNLKLFVNEIEKPTLDQVLREGILYPDDGYLYTRNFSELFLSSNMTFESEGQSARSVLFHYNSSSTYNFTGEFFAGISIDVNDTQLFDWLREEDPGCLGDDLVTECEVMLEVVVQIETQILECLYWDTGMQIWSNNGCEVSPYSSPAILQCLCTHLTSFSGGVFVMPNFVDPIADAALFLTFFDNPVVVTAVIVVWLLYFFLIHWARRADRLDKEQVGVIWCGDHNDSHSYMYLMCVVTGWWADAGSTANVYCSIKGSEGSSLRKKLTTCVRPCFQTGYEDWFVFTTEHSLGNLHNVCLWHDNSGTSPHWYLKQVYVKDLQTQNSWTFIYNDWLAVDRGSILQTTATVSAVTKEELAHKRQHNFSVKSTRDLRDGHLWISIFSKPARSTFTRVQRLTCALSLLLTTMLTNIMFYGVPTDEPEDQVGGAGGVAISLSAIVIGIESSLLMFPVNLIILQLFLKLKPKPASDEIEWVQVGGRVDSSKPSSMHQLIDHSIQMGTHFFNRWSKWIPFFHREKKDEGNFHSVIFEDPSLQHEWPTRVHVQDSSMNQPSVTGLVRWFSALSFMPAREDSNLSIPGIHSLSHGQLGNKPTISRVTVVSETKSTGKILPWWFVYIAWTLVISVSLISSYFVMLYGLKYGYERSVEWLVSFLTGFTQSAFITQPIKVFAIAVVITLVFKKTVEFEDYGPDIRIDKDEVFVNKVSEPPETHVPYTEPLSAKLLAEIKQRLHMEWLMDMTLRDIALYIVYMVIVLLVVHGHRDVPRAYMNTQAIEDVLINPGCVNLNHCFFLEKADKVETFYQYLYDVAIPSLADMAESDHQYATPGSSHFLLGPWRLRQLRIDKGSCDDGSKELLEYFNMAMLECTDSYWITDEDTTNYNATWAQTMNEAPTDPTPWTYQSAWKLKTLPSTGNLATYSGGGYVLTMPSDTALHKGVLDDIQTTDWVDERTRAVFLEFTLYNPNADLFSVIMILFEFSNNGGVIPSHHIFSTSLYHYSTDFAVFVSVCEVLFLCFNIGFTYIEYKKLKTLGRKEYFKDFWSYVEFIQITLSYSVIGLFFQRMVSVNGIMDNFRESDGNTYISFYAAISWDFILGYVMGFLVAVVTLKSIKLLKFNRRAFLVGDTLFHSKDMILSFVFMAVVFGVAFAHFTVMAFGNWISGYKAMLTSLMTVFNFALGVSDLPTLQDTNRVLGPAYFVIFVFVAQFCFLTIFVAILNFGISDSKAMFEQRKNKFELLQYMKTKVKTIANIK